MALTKVSGSVLKNPLSLSGNVSVGGTLTYEDVTNVDAVGVVTAREGIRVGAGKSIGSDGAAVVYYGDGSNLTGISAGVSLTNGADNRVITASSASAITGEANLTFDGTNLDIDSDSGHLRIGADQDLDLYHNGSNGYLKNSTGQQLYRSGTHTFENAAGSTEYLRIDSSGRLLIGTTTEGRPGADQLTIASSGHAGITIRSGTNSDGQIFFSDATSGTSEYQGYIFYSHGDENLVFGTSADERLSINGSGYIKHTGLRSGNSQNKLAILRTPSYNTSEEDVALYIAENESGSNQITFGGGTSAYNAATNIRFLTAAAVNTTTGSERLRITSTGQLVVGTNPTVSSGNIVHIEAPTSFNSGETIVNIEGNNATAGPRLLLHNNNTGANAHGEILGVDAGGQSTSSIRFYNTDQSNNYGEIAFGTRNQSGVPPEDRMRIKRNGNIGIGDADPQTKLHIAGSLCGGTSNQPFLRFFDSGDRQRNTKHYFKCVKGSTSIFDILTVDLNQNFHQALIILYYGARIQNGWDSTTFPVHKIIGVNRFNGGSIQFTKNTIVQDSTVSTHANIDAVATSSTNYRIRLTWSGTAGGSSFACGSVEIIGVGSGDDGAFYSLAHSHGLLA